MPSTCYTALHSLVFTSFLTDLQEIASVAHHQRSAKPVRGKGAQIVSRAKESVTWPHDGFLSLQNNANSCSQLGSQQTTWGHERYTHLQKEAVGNGGQWGKDKRQRGEHAGGQEKSRGRRYRVGQHNNRAPQNAGISRNGRDGSRQTEFNESGRKVETVYQL